jgi:predicted transcriptional regulator
MSIPSPEEIERRVKSAGLSMREACKRADVHQSTWSRWKSGKGATVGALQRLVDVVVAAERARGAADQPSGAARC